MILIAFSKSFSQYSGNFVANIKKLNLKRCRTWSENIILKPPEGFCFLGFFVCLLVFVVVVVFALKRNKWRRNPLLQIRNEYSKGQAQHPFLPEPVFLELVLRVFSNLYILSIFPLVQKSWTLVSERISVIYLSQRGWTTYFDS